MTLPFDPGARKPPTLFRGQPPRTAVPHGAGGGGGGGGGGGKGGKGGGSHTATDSANTLVSSTQAVTIDLLSYGPVAGGVTNTSADIFLDGTAVSTVNPSGGAIHNVVGCAFLLFGGTPDQDALAGAAAYAANTYSVNIQVKYGNPITKQIADQDADQCTIALQIPSIYSVDKEGDVNPATVTISIQVTSNGGKPVTVVTDVIDGKTTQPYESSYTVNLPPGGYPWTVTMTRVSGDSTSDTYYNDTYFAYYTETVSNRFSYPDQAYLVSIFDATTFGSSVPSRTVLMKGRILQVPTNYNPVTRAYSGVWDGTFQQAWTDNPAWVFYDMLTHPVYGMGQYVEADNINKFDLYLIAQYCDGLVPDGSGGMEPRLRFNAQLTTQDQAYNVLQTLAAAFRGMIYWGIGAVVPVCDMPRTPILDIVNAAVVGGRFVYTGTPMSSLHSVFHVTWQDPTNNYIPTIETVQNDQLLQTVGYRELSITAPGCTSRGQARRLGLWTMYSESLQAETVTFSVPLSNYADLRPGQLINIVDNDYENLLFGGRITFLDTVNNILHLDRVVTLPGEDSSLYQVHFIDGTGTGQVFNFTFEADASTAGVYGYEVQALQLSEPCAVAPYPNAVFTISNTGFVGGHRQWSILNIEEGDDDTYDFTCIFYDPSKYTLVEQGYSVAEPPYSTYPTGAIQPPFGLDVLEHFTTSGLQVVTSFLLSWQAAPDPRVTSYQADVMYPGDTTWSPLGETSATSFDLVGSVQGDYQARVRSNSAFGYSNYATIDQTISASLGQPDTVTGFAVSITGATALFMWNPVAQDAYCAYEIRFSPQASRLGTAQNLNWETAGLVLTNIKATSVSVPYQDGLWYVKAYTLTAPPTYSQFQTVLETFTGANGYGELQALTVVCDPSYNGTLSRCEVVTVDGISQLVFNIADVNASYNTAEADTPPYYGCDPATLIGTYEPPYVDLGSNQLVRLIVSAIGFGTIQLSAGAAVISTWGKLSAIVTLDSSASSDWQINYLVSVTNTDPTAAGAVWSAFVPITGGQVTAWGVQVQVELTVLPTSNTPSEWVVPTVYQLSYQTNVPPRTVTSGDTPGTAVAVTTDSNGNLKVVFASPFYQTPAIQVSISEGAQPGDYYILNSSTASGFSLTTYAAETSTGTQRTVTWTAIGFGIQVAIP